MADSVINPATASTRAVGASAQFSTVLMEGGVYSIVSTTACWILTGSNPTATAQGAGTLYIPANFPVVFICPPGATKLAIIQDAAPGFATLALCSA